MQNVKTPREPIKMMTAIRDLGLERYVLELEVDGLTVVPPDVHGFPMDRFDQMVELLLQRAEEMTGCAFDVDVGPLAELEFPANPNESGIRESGGQPSQFLIQQLGRQHRLFRDLAVNPAAIALIKHMIGPNATRFSSHNSFIKWQGQFGYGPLLGLHSDQNNIPYPWGRGALTANTNWCLTDYSKEGGALAYVPGSHRKGTRPIQPQAAAAAVAVEAPKGSLVVFHGATWHGAFPRMIPGMRISVANYYRHVMITSQENIQGTFPRELADDCDDPGSFKALAGFTDEFPYDAQSQAVPSAKRA